MGQAYSFRWPTGPKATPRGVNTYRIGAGSANPARIVTLNNDPRVCGQCR